MINYDLVYELQTETEEDIIQHFFVSQGNADIVKAIQYRRTGTYENKTVFNLGFGNYDVESDMIFDEDNSNNGDHYHVFNTVLSTIPHFFTRYPDDMIMIMGSDNHPDFPATCRPGCTKNCPPGTCRNFRRRIRTYQGYVEKYWRELQEEYEFRGGSLTEEGTVEIANYVIGISYDAVLVFKRKS
jgi:hypothetical protein